MAIDEPLDKIREILKEGDDDLLGALVPFGAAFEPVTGVISAVKCALDSAERGHRIRSAILALCDELQWMKAKLPSDAATALHSDWFKKAVAVLIEEASRSTTEERAMELAKALARGCFPNSENGHRQEDLATYISDLARLGAEDLQMLRLLRDAYQSPIRMTPNMHDPNYFTEHFGRFKQMAADLKIHPDDCVSLGARLAGFGLAYEATRNGSRQSPGEHCFRPTRRGVYLLSLLEAAEAPSGTQN